jgi:glycosyltransferase involved in cell wall biosynthesis
MRQYLWWEAASLIGRRLRARGLTSEISWYDVLFCGHDLQVSRRLETKLNAVYTYEDGARLTLEVAKRQGSTKLYELPAGYYLGVVNEMELAVKTTPDIDIQIKHTPAWKQERKDKELELADLVVVPCEWARESLRFSRIDKQKTVIKVPYGTPSDEVSVRLKRPNGPFTVLFAGKVGVRKGVPYLLEAWSQLGLKNARLWLAGGMSLDEPFLRRHCGTVEYLGAMPRTKLLELMKEADLLVFPSLAEGFGLVIGEAMAVGTPVLTTTNTGGPELITDGQEGWCIPPHDAQLLAERIEWAYLHREELFEMGQLARLKAEQWTWSHYRRQLIEKVTPYLKQVSN